MRDFNMKLKFDIVYTEQLVFPHTSTIINFYHRNDIFRSQKQPVHACMLSRFSRVRLQATPWTVCSPPGSSVHGILQARILERQPCPPPGDLTNPGMEPPSFMSPALAGRYFTSRTTWEAKSCVILAILYSSI